MDSWQAIQVFLCFFFLSIKTVNSAYVFTLIRGDNTSTNGYGEQDRFTFNLRCGTGKAKQTWCKTFNAGIIPAITVNCTCRCPDRSSTFILAKEKCVKNEFVRSNLSMGYGKKGCRYVFGYKAVGRPLAVVKPSFTYKLNIKGHPIGDYDIGSIEYFTPDQKWVRFSTDNGVFSTEWTNTVDLPLQLNVSSNITKYHHILGRIVKVTLGNASRNECVLFKVAGQWTYFNWTGTSVSLLKPSTTMQTFKNSTKYSLRTTFPNTTGRNTLFLTSSLITTLQKSTHALVLGSSSVDITSSVAGTTTPTATAAIYPKGTQTSTRPLVIKSSSVHATFSVGETRNLLPSKRLQAAISPSGTDEPSTSNSKPPVSGKRSGSSNVGAAVGGGVGALILLVALILLIKCVLYHRKRRTGSPKRFPALNNPAYVTENSFSLEKCNVEEKSEKNYLAPADRKLNKPYKSLVKNQPVNTGPEGEDYTYAVGDGLPRAEPHYTLVKEKTPNSTVSTGVKSTVEDPVYNVLENDASPFYDVLEQSDSKGSDSGIPPRPRYVQPSKQRKSSEQKRDKALPAPAPVYDVLEGPDSDRSQGPLQTAFYDVVEGPNPSTDTSFPQKSARAQDTNGHAQTGASQTPLYDVLEGPECNESTEKNNNRSGSQTYEALHPARESIYQPLNGDNDDDYDNYDNSYQSISG